MSTRTETTLICDMPDEVLGEPEHPASRTVGLSLGRDAWEIDVCPGHRARIDATLHPFIAAARPAGRRDRPKRSASQRGDAAAIRAWAIEQGIPVIDRGRLPNLVVAEYEAAHKAARGGKR